MDEYLYTLFRETFNFTPGLISMLKLIIALILLLYVLNKVSVIIFRVFGQSRPAPPPNFRRPSEGSVHMDGTQRKSTRKGGLKGGEYVDYEEVK